MSLYSLLRPLAFALDPERAHHLTMRLLSLVHRSGASKLLGAASDSRPVEVMGLRFPNAVGLAAGLDKDGAYIDALAGLGFGFLEIGTVTPRPQPGNPQPRLFRLPQAHAIINRMGFNNLGVDAFVQNVQRSSFYQAGGILGLNIGKNAATPIERAAEDYLYCLERVYPYASYITVNISSPNTKNLRQLQDGDALDDLLRALQSRRGQLADQHRRWVPLALKIAPDLDEEQIAAIGQTVLRHRIDAVIATNTTLSRKAVEGLPHADEAGGLSGGPVRDLSTQVISALSHRLEGRVPLIGVGGILSGADARAKLDAGASLIQLYTGLIYRGPALVGECVGATARRA